MPPILKPVAIHAVVGNAPHIISAAATAAPSAVRTFNGIGAPSSTTLPAGNGMYNAGTSGFVVNASLANAGSGYNVGDMLEVSGGTGTPMHITVDMVNPSGEIIDFHASQVGNYSAYPTLPAPTTDTSGSGSGAQFNLNCPQPDYYLDLTTPTGPVLWMCMTSGSNSSSVWAKISGSVSGNQVSLFAVSELFNSDYFEAVGLSISYVSGVLHVAFGEGTSIAKSRYQRVSVQSEVFDGVTITYYPPSGGSSYTLDNYRSAYDPAGNMEFQVCRPPYMTAGTLGYSFTTTLTGSTASGFLNSQCIIKAVNLPAGVGMVDGSDNQIYWEEITDHKWVRNYVQTTGD
jgi:hypothetical protein